MFKNLIRGLLLATILALFSLPSFAQTGDLFRVTVTSLNARLGPGIEYDVIAQLPRHGMYDITGYSETGNWVLLDLGFAQAWAFRHSGVVISPATSTTVVTSTGVTVTDVSSFGQGGGFVAPVYDSSSLGQGGGFVPQTMVIMPSSITFPTVTENGVDISVMQTEEQFNSTVGVFGTTNLRMSPSLRARVLTIIPYDERAVPLGRNSTATWIQVNYDGVVGWVYFLTVAFPPAIDVRTLPVTG